MSEQDDDAGMSEATSEQHKTMIMLVKLVALGDERSAVDLCNRITALFQERDTARQEAEEVPGLKIVRYEHGGGRVYIERENGSRDLVVDLYDDEPGTRRDAIITLLVESGLLTARQRP